MIVHGLPKQVAPPAGFPHERKSGSGVVVAGPEPVDAPDEVDHEEKCENEVNLADCSHNEIAIGFTGRAQYRPTDVQTGCKKHGHT
jgi:hypothetical protein